MIAADTSAIVAIIFDEPERSAFTAAINEAAKVLISSVSVVETKMALYSRWGTRAVILADDLLSLPQFEITPPNLADMDAAVAAFLVYGKGSRPRAGLNFRDVFSYALAKVRDLPLLCKGNDFAETDLRLAVRNSSD
jgi:ribonuclease VapC